MKIVSMVGNRPQFIKLFPLVQTIQEYNRSNFDRDIEHLIIHTGQHYDYELNKIFFDELGIPEPAYSLEVGSGSHGWQTGEIIKRAEEVLVKEKPDWVLVFGDTNSTLAAALSAAKLQVPIAHVEAGLRSYNRRMPEEINRILTDHCSDILFCPTENSVKNLKKEGFRNVVNKGKLVNSGYPESSIPDLQFPVVINVGDIMYDILLLSLAQAEKKSTILEKLNLKPKNYYLATLHRVENTNDINRLKTIMTAFIEISREKPLVFPIHPGTKKILEKNNIPLQACAQVHLIEPVSYFDMLQLEKNATKILTDSGGIQKEAYLLEIPCITLRKETEWVETLEGGWNKLVDPDKKIEIKDLKESTTPRRKNRKKHFGEGSTSRTLLNVLMKKGFTLIELLVVIALIGLSVSIVIPNIANTYDKIKFKAETKKVYELMQKLKFAAFCYQKNIVISESENNLVVNGFDLQSEEIPSLQYNVKKEIRFLPNGVSSGGEILIYFKGRPKTAIKVERFSGDIKLESL